MFWDCANHYQHAGEIDRAVALVSRRADYALQTGALQEAVNMWDRASSIHSPQGGLVSVVKGRLIASLRAASMWTRILRTAAASEMSPQSGTAAPHVHDDAELAVLEAQWQTCQATTPLLQQALACLRDSTASPAHRAEAGVWALIFSHNLPYSDLAQTVIATVRALPMRHTHLRDQIVADLVYNTAFGDLASGAAAGMRLSELSRQSQSLPDLCRGLRQAAIPLLYLGEFATARELLLEALAAAECMGSAWAITTTTTLIARSYFEEGNYTAAKDWHARSVDQIAAAPGQSRTPLDVPFVGAQIAILEERLGARELVEFPPPAYWLGVESPRLQSMALSIFALWRIRTGEPFADAAAFKNVFQKASCTGGQDFAAYARFELERTTGGNSRGHDLLTRYVRTSRRERSPLPPFLVSTPS